MEPEPEPEPERKSAIRATQDPQDSNYHILYLQVFSADRTASAARQLLKIYHESRSLQLPPVRWVVPFRQARAGERFGPRSTGS